MPHTMADIVADFMTDDGELLTTEEVTDEDDEADNVIDVLFSDDEDCEDCDDTLWRAAVVNVQCSSDMAFYH